MLRFFGLILLFAVCASFVLFDEDYTACLVKYDSRWGAECTQCKVSDNSYRVSLRNTCRDSIDVKCAVQESDKRWKTFIKLQMGPNDTMIAYACEGRGKYLYWARLAGDVSTPFPSDEEINAQYNK